jgi:DNA-binding IscR family transcriptional regulator
MLKQRTISALRVIRRINQGPATARGMATELGMALSYVEQICSVLVSKMNLMQGKRGRGGGYVLARDPEEISLNELHRSLYDKEPTMRLPITAANAIKLLAEEASIQEVVKAA